MFSEGIVISGRVGTVMGSDVDSVVGELVVLGVVSRLSRLLPQADMLKISARISVNMAVFFITYSF